MGDTLHIQIDKNIEVHHPHVCLQDIARLSCSSQKTLNRLRVMPVASLEPDRPGRYVMSVTELIKEIQAREPSLDISTTGEPTFIITYQNEPAASPVWRWCKIVFVCLATFFGAAFSIMTFNNDVDVPALFRQLHQQVTGSSGSGFSVLEISYSVGIGLGVLIFFNHFGHLKLTDDPTPMQIQMRLYEDDVNTTIIEETDRLPKSGKNAFKD